MAKAVCTGSQYLRVGFPISWIMEGVAVCSIHRSASGDSCVLNFLAVAEIAAYESVLWIVLGMFSRR